MSISILLEDAGGLWRADRKIGAFVLVLVTVSATARKRYPRGTPSRIKPDKEMGDGEAFKQFVVDEMDKVTGGPKYNVAFPFMGSDKVPLEEILYSHLRCQLVHEAAMPGSICLTRTQERDGAIEHVLKLTDPLGFPEGWINNLAIAVRLAPENTHDSPEPANHAVDRTPDKTQWCCAVVSVAGAGHCKR